MSGYKFYLGDGAYVDFDGYGIILTAENGIEATDRVYLEPEIWQRLMEWKQNLERELELTRPPHEAESEPGK